MEKNVHLIEKKKIVVAIIENGEELWIRVRFSFFLFFVFHAKSGPTNNQRRELSDISFYIPLSLDQVPQIIIGLLG